jgi:hypothetical protein
MVILWQRSRSHKSRAASTGRSVRSRLEGTWSEKDACHSKEVEATPQILGMVRTVEHLVKVKR